MSGFNTSADEKKQRPIPPQGQHLSMCFQIIDLGTQLKTFQGIPKEVHEVQFGWEIPGQKAVFDPQKGPQVMAVFNSYTFSLNEKSNFRKMIDSWVGKEVKALTSELMKKFLGKPCMIQIVHQKDKTNDKISYANIAQKGIAVYKRQADVPFPATTENEQLFFDLTAFSWEVFDKLPKHIQGKIEKCKEWPSILKKYPRANNQSSNSIDTDDNLITQSTEEEDPF